MAEIIKITVIIPVYNVEAYIGRCLESVINQSLSDIEIICIDDRSTDNSLNIVKQYVKKDKRIRCLRNESNKGLSYSRNVGLSAATGEYIFFLDSDDAIRDGTLEKLYNIATVSRYQMVFFDFSNMYESSSLREALKYADKDRSYLNGEWRGSDLFVKMVENSDMQPQACVKLYCREFLLCNSLFFHEGMLHEDIPFAVKAMFKAEKIYFTGDKMYEWWHRESSITTAKTSVAHIEGRIRGIIEIIEFVETITITAAEQQALERYVISLINVTRQKLELLDSCEKIFCADLKYRLISDMILYSKKKRISVNQKKRIFEAKKIFLYGAGIVAQLAMEEIAQENVGICGVIVTELQNQLYFYGHRVVAAESISDDMKDNMVIVATSAASHKEIGRYLKKLGFRRVEYIEWEN